MLLDPVLLEAKCKEGDVEHNIAPIAIGHDPHITKFGPYEHIYARYVRGDNLNIDNLHVLRSQTYETSHRASSLTVRRRSTNTTMFTGAQKEKFPAHLLQKTFALKSFKSCLQLRSRKEVLYLN